MRKLVNLLVRRDGLSHDEFLDYWLNEHAPMAESLPGVRRYATSVPADPEQAAYDGIAELSLTSGASVGDTFAERVGLILVTIGQQVGVGLIGDELHDRQ